MKTYKIYGILGKDMGHYIMSRTLCSEVQAATEQGAIDSFEVGGWKFESVAIIEYVSEVQKLVKARQPALFALEDYNDAYTVHQAKL